METKARTRKPPRNPMSPRSQEKDPTTEAVTAVDGEAVEAIAVDLGGKVLSVSVDHNTAVAVSPLVDLGVDAEDSTAVLHSGR